MSSPASNTPSIRAWFERAISPGLGMCYRCRRPWKFPAQRRVKGKRNTWQQLDRDRFWGLVGVEEHSTNYKDGSGCFPLCEGCWTALSPQERLPYYRRLWDRWLTSALDDPILHRGDDWIYDLHQDWPKIERAVLSGF